MLDVAPNTVASAVLPAPSSAALPRTTNRTDAPAFGLPSGAKGPLAHSRPQQGSAQRPPPGRGGVCVQLSARSVSTHPSFSLLESVTVLCHARIISVGLFAVADEFFLSPSLPPSPTRAGMRRVCSPGSGRKEDKAGAWVVRPRHCRPARPPRPPLCACTLEAHRLADACDQPWHRSAR